MVGTVMGPEAAAPAAVVATQQKRDIRLDFFRGLALFFIFIDHIPNNLFSRFTLHAIGFSDAAEVFIFISGYAASIAYGRIFLNRGAWLGTLMAWRRAWQLYVAHIFLFVLFTAEVSYTVLTFRNPMYNDELQIGNFLAAPHIAIIKALLLQFQPTFLDVLPLYIVLLLLLPAIILLTRANAVMALVLSCAVYVMVHATGFNVPTFPEGHFWFFNPLAWQFLFTIGVVCGWRQQHGQACIPPWRWVRWLAIGFALASAVVAVSWQIHWVYDDVPALLLHRLFPIDKTSLDPIRLVHFLAVAVVGVTLVKVDAPWLGHAIGRMVRMCGRHSLHIFCLSILLSTLAHFVLTEFSSLVAMQAAVNLAGILLMVAVAGVLEFYRSAGRQARPRPVGGAVQ